MAQIIGGFASSHTPLMSLPGEQWHLRADDDTRNKELVQAVTGRHMPYNELLKEADPDIAKQINVETFVRKYDSIQKNLNLLDEYFGAANPDVVVMFGDDQDEMWFEDNMPSINVFWGEKARFAARRSATATNTTAAIQVSNSVYHVDTEDWPVESNLGLHIIETLMERDFDPSHSRYFHEQYGGSIGPATWYLDWKRETKPRRQGLGHAFAFPVNRWFHGLQPEIVPIEINTCYPPNWISPRRAYALGRAVRDAIQSWDSDKRVAIVTSGGLSHFVVDEELDRIALKGLSEANGEVLTNLPRHRLQSASTEILNWVAAAGAMGDTPMEVMMYEPGYRSLAGTGCGCAVGRWVV